tara:strand:- start:776 stop:1051 length:276 start_codon:yes stop_codon:yes gene_type:complete
MTTVNATIKILRNSEVLRILNISRSSLYLKLGEGIFPPAISLGDRAVGFLAHEVQKTLVAMAKGADKEDLKTLVILMIQDRQNLSEVSNYE